MPAIRRWIAPRRTVYISIGGELVHEPGAGRMAFSHALIISSRKGGIGRTQPVHHSANRHGAAEHRSKERRQPSISSVDIREDPSTATSFLWAPICRFLRRARRANSAFSDATRDFSPAPKLPQLDPLPSRGRNTRKRSCSPTKFSFGISLARNVLEK